MSPVLDLFAPEAETACPEETQGSRTAWSQGLQANLDPKSQPDVSFTGLPHNKEIPDSGPKVDDLW